MCHALFLDITKKLKKIKKNLQHKRRGAEAKGVTTTTTTMDVEAVTNPVDLSASSEDLFEADVLLLPPPPPPRVDAFARYMQHVLDGKGMSHLTIQKPLGRGVYGEVYEACDRNGPKGADGRHPRLAIKLIRVRAPPCLENDLGLPISPLREAALLKSLRGHENILEYKFAVPHTDVYGQTNVLLGASLCEGGTLGDYIRRHSSARWGHAPADDAASFARQLLSAVDFMHERRVLHRDIKPDNIGLDRHHMRLRLMDFGLARAFRGDQNTEYTNRCVTLGYRPPELLFGATKYDSSVDVWSVGCVLVNLCLLDAYGQWTSDTEVASIVLMCKTFGTPNETTWPGVTSLPFFIPMFPVWPPKTLADYPYFLERMPAAVHDAVSGMLVMCPDQRISAAVALLRLHSDELEEEGMKDEEKEEEMGQAVGAKRRCPESSDH